VLRRWTSLVLILVLALQPLQSHSAQIKSGTTCTKKGVTRIIDGKKYVCVLSGRKLIWSKAASVKPSPSSSPSLPKPTTSASSAPSISPSATPEIRPPSDDWANYPWIQNTIAISKIGREPKDKFTISKVFMSPNFDKAIADGLLEYTNIASTYWYQVGVRITQPIEIAMFTEKDLEWFKSTIGITAPVIEGFFAHPEPSIYFNGTVIIGSIPAKRFVISYFVGTNYRDSRKYLSTTSSWTTALANMATHEFQHLIQYSRTLTTTNGNLQAKLPCWFNEGMAAFYEDSFYLEEPTPNSLKKYLQDSLDTRGESLKIRKKRVQLLLSNTNSYTFDKRSVDGWYEFVTSNYDQSSSACSKTQYGYTLGRFLLEKFYIDQGSDKLLAILDDFQKSLNFDTSFNAIIGSTPQIWLREVGLPYFLTETK
jgi:hypothetical protein